MITVRRREERGRTDTGWLTSRHSFSFGGYHDPDFMGVSVLRVINDDRVEPGAGFAPHSHRDMEIISYVTRGRIEHRDSMGHVQRLPAGEFQVMSAGSGVTHSEYNGSDSEPLEFLQIWIVPDRRGIEPGYQQKRFEPAEGVQLIASPDARDGSMRLQQDAALYRLILSPRTLSHALAAGRRAYVHVVRGELAVCGERLRAGDGATITETPSIDLCGTDEAEALLFDLP